MKETVFNWYGNLYADVVDRLNAGTTIANIFGGRDSTFATIQNAILNFMAGDFTNMMSAIALAIATLFFVISLLDLAMTDRFTLEYFIKYFSKFAASIVLITMCAELTTLISDFGTAFCTEIADKISTVDGVRNDVATSVANAFDQSGLNWIFVVVSGLINMGVLSLASLVVVIVVYLVGFTRLMELSVRAAFMPIAFALLADDGWHGAGGRYIKKYLAICCQSAMLCMIGALHSVAFCECIKIFNDQIADIKSPGSTPSSVIMMFGLSFATISLMFKSIGIINDVFGA